MGVPALLWADLTPDHLDQLDQAEDEAATHRVLCEATGLTDDDPQLAEPSGVMCRSVLLEFYVNILRYAHQHGFSKEQTSTFFSLMKQVHQEMASAFLSAHRCWELFKALQLAHSVQRPPYSIGIFGLREAQLVTEFALEYYFRHFKLFRYTFTMEHVKELEVRCSHLELPPASFPSLADGVPAIDEPVSEEPAVPEPLPEIPPLQLDVPPEMLERVQQQLAAEVARVREELEREYAGRMAAHESKLAALEAK